MPLMPVLINTGFCIIINSFHMHMWLALVVIGKIFANKVSHYKTNKNETNATDYPRICINQFIV